MGGNKTLKNHSHYWVLYYWYYWYYWYQLHYWILNYWLSIILLEICELILSATSPKFGHLEELEREANWFEVAAQCVWRQL